MGHHFEPVHSDGGETEGGDVDRSTLQILVFSKIHPAENGSIRAIPANLLFFLDVTFKLFQHFSGLFDIKYQMS